MSVNAVLERPKAKAGFQKKASVEKEATKQATLAQLEKQLALPALKDPELEADTCLPAKGRVLEAETSPYRQWNPSAVACFVRNAQCDGCFYNGFFSDRPYGCHMADAVQHLLKKVGPPDKRRLEKCY